MKKLLRKISNKLVRTKITPFFVPVTKDTVLESKVALIVGGSGGIGFGIAKRFVSSGCKVILTGTNEEKLIKHTEALGENAKYILTNVKNISEIKAKISEAANFFGKIDIMVYSVGVHCQNKFGNITENDWDDDLDINLKGMYFYCQEFANYLIGNNLKGHILNISSASCAKPGWTPYEISKAGVRSLTLGLADKLIPKGIVVNSIAPGPVATDMLGVKNEDDLTWQGNPTGRMATVEEIAELAVFMASGQGDLIVGDTYFISGGSGTVCLDR